MKMGLSLALSFSLTASAAPARAQEPPVLERVWTGIYTVIEARIVEDPSAALGKRLISGAPTLQLATTRIPARIGTRFGIRFVFRGAKGTTVAYRHTWRYPARGLTDPASGKTIYESTASRSVRVDEPVHTGHAFVFDWGLVPGPYVVELWVGERKLIEQSFDVFLP